MSQKHKKGVSKKLLDLCIGSDLEQQRIAEKVASNTTAVVREKDGLEVEAETWTKLHKKNLTK